MTPRKATRPHPSSNQVGKPFKAQPCQCPEPFGDPRVGTCEKCGRQVKGYSMPAKAPVYSLNVGVDQSTFAQSRRKFRPAA